MSLDKNYLDDSGLGTLIQQTNARFAMLRKGVAGGVAELDSNGKVPAAEVGADAALSTTSTNPIQNAAVATEIQTLTNLSSALGLSVVNGEVCQTYNV